MATSFKSLTNNDVTSTRTLLHEAIPITGTIVSGTYQRGEGGSEENIKNFSHGMFQAVYDYPYLSSSANHIFDITYGIAPEITASLAGAGALSTDLDKKSRMYAQMAQTLAGYRQDSSIRRFDRDGNLAGTGSAGQGTLDECFFVSFARLLTKDEIKRGSMAVSFVTGGAWDGSAVDIDTSNTLPWSAISGSRRDALLTLGDYNATNKYFVNSPAGEYGILYTSSANIQEGSGLGLIYYQAGIAVITSSIFAQNCLRGDDAGNAASHDTTGSLQYISSSYFGVNNKTVWEESTGSTIQALCNGFRNRLSNISFNNTVELNSTIYYTRANHNEFNYSSNPTYVSGSKLKVKNVSADMPVSYITTVGLYSADNELLAVAKLSEPLKKDPTTEFTLRVRLDY
tara:strand:- start:287 stop:1483 length:1197 start_codon:yes stop_codon:yes gene_type:complete